MWLDSVSHPAACPAPGNAWLTIAVSGPMARNVSDVALLLSAMAGPDPRCPISITEPGSRFAGSLDATSKASASPGSRTWAGSRSIPACCRVNAQRKVFENLGCIVEEAEPDWAGAHDSYDTIRAWGYAASQAENIRLHRDLVKDTIQWEAERGSKLVRADIAHANAMRSKAWDNMRMFQEQYEYFISPTSQVLPYDVTQPYPTEIAGVKMSTYIEWQKSCILISSLENPAISMPCGFTDDGLPVGLQIVGRHRDDWSVLQLARAFEKATGGFKRKPAIA